jgi:hypothetical protein
MCSVALCALFFHFPTLVFNLIVCAFYSPASHPRRSYSTAPGNVLMVNGDKPWALVLNTQYLMQVQTSV